MLEIHVDVVIAFEFGADIGEGFDEAEFVDTLGVVGDGAVAVDGDGDRTHAEESEGDETKGEDGDGGSRAGVEEGFHAGCAAPGGDGVGDCHEASDEAAHPECGEITGCQSAEDVQGCSAFAAGINDLADVAAVGAGEDFGEFGDERAGGGAACDDGGELPPDRWIDGGVALEEEIGGEVGRADGDYAGHEDQAGEGPFEIHDIGVEIFCAGD